VTDVAEPTHVRWRRRYYPVLTLVGALLFTVTVGWAFGKVFPAYVPFLLAPSVLGTPYSMMIALIGGVLNTMPWTGPAITAVIPGVSGATVEPWFVLWSALVVIGAQQLREWFVRPRVMSGQVDLHPVLMVFSILVGGALSGFRGVVLATSVAAIGKALFVYYLEKHTDSVVGTADGALSRMQHTPEGPSGRREQAPSGGPGGAADVSADTERRPEEGDS